jgi:hypothetical protein
MRLVRQSIRDRNESLQVTGHSKGATHYLLGYRALHSASFEERLREVHVFVFRVEFLIKIKQFVMAK